MYTEKCFNDDDDDDDEEEARGKICSVTAAVSLQMTLKLTTQPTELKL